MRGIAAGSVVNINLPRDSVENKSRGFGYVDFSTVEDLTKALLVSNQFAIRNRVVRVDMSDSKPQNDREPRPAESNRNWRDGAGQFVSAGSRTMMQNDRGDRPLSAAEVSRNWRDGATPISSQDAPRIIAQRSFLNESSAPAAAVVATNWREGAKPVEKSFDSLSISTATSINFDRPVPVQKNWRETAQAVVVTADKTATAVSEELNVNVKVKREDEVKFVRKEINKEAPIPSTAAADAPTATRSWRRTE